MKSEPMDLNEVATEDLVAILRHVSVETGSLACLGCGHEHNCGTRGCALIREAADRLDALRTPTREQVEKVWRGEWIVGEPNGLGFPIHCSRCGWGTDHADPRKWMDYGGHIFCGRCGAPVTDEAVEIRLKELEALKDGKND